MTSYMNCFQRPVSGTPFGQLDAIEGGYLAAGLPAPSRVDEALTLLDNEPGVPDVARQLADEMIKSGNVEAFVKGAQARISRAVTVSEVRGHLRAAVADRIGDTLGELRQAAVDAVTPAFEAAVAELSDLARQLPAGPNPLDVDRAFNSGVSREVLRARELLALMARLAAVWVAAPYGAAPAGARDLALVVDLESDGGLPPVSAVNLAGAAPATVGLDATLVRVSRGDYKGCSLGLAGSAEEVQRRAALLAAAAGAYGSRRRLYALMERRSA